MSEAEGRERGREALYGSEATFGRRKRGPIVMPQRKFQEPNSKNQAGKQSFFGIWFLEIGS